MADRVILACTVVVAVIYLYATTQIPTLAVGDPLGPKAFPRLLGIALLLAAGLLALELWRDRRKQRAQPSEPQVVPRVDWHVAGVLFMVVFWTGCYFLVFEKLGYVVATAIYLLPLMAWFNRGKWVANIASTVLFVVLTYFMFVKLEVRLPPGVLPL